MKSVLMLAAGLSAWSLLADAADPAKTLDPGGLSSADFLKVTHETKVAKETGQDENLLPRSVSYMNFSFGANQGGLPGGWNDSWKERETKMRALITHSKNRTPGNKNNTFIMETPATISQFKDERNRPSVHHRLMPVTDLEVLPDAQYTLTFPLRGSLPPGENYFRINLDFYGADGKKKIKSEYHGFTPTAAWADHTLRFITPPGSAYLRLHFEICNIGSVEFGVGTLTLKKKLNSYEVMLYPMGGIDNVYCVSSGQVNFIGFAQQIQDGKIPANPQMALVLPAEFRVLDGAPWGKLVSSTQNADGTVTHLINCREYSWGSTAVKDFSAIFPAQFAITTDLAPSDKEYKMTYYAVSGDYRSEPKTAMLKVIAPVRGEQPKIFKTGIYDSRFTLAKQDVFAQFAREYRGMGFNVFYNFVTDHYVTDAIREQGILCMGNAPFIGDGYSFYAMPDQRPAYTHFIGVDGKPVADYNGRVQLICPMAVISRTDYYKDVFLKKVKDMLADRDYFMNNWEPGSAQTSAGCFCDNCKKEFIAYTHLPEAEVSAAWPRSIMSRYRTQWMNFKSHQHALYLSTIEKDIDDIARAMGKKDGSGFMPMITRDLMMDSEYNLTDINAFAVRFYAESIKWINPWGPYLGHYWRNLKRDLPGSRIRMLTTARSAVRFLDKVVPAGKRRPNLMAFPNGVCVGMVVAPEQLTMDTLSVFVGRWQGSMPYYFPCNYDARWWQALANANTIIARTEDIVMGGKIMKGVQAKPVTEYVPSLYAELDKPEKPISALDVTGYEKDGNVCIATGNFWEYGEVFFQLTVPGLPDGQRYKLYDVFTGTVFADKDGNNFTGRELAAGILQHAGAIRWVFLKLEKTSEQKATEGAITETQMKQVMTVRSAQLKKAAEEERKFVSTQAAPVEVPADVTIFKPLENKGVSVSLEKLKPNTKVMVKAYDLAIGSAGDESSVFTVKAGHSEWKVNAEKGLLISSWLFNGVELSSGKESEALSVDGPWVPAMRFIRPFNLTKVEKTENGISLEFTRTLNVNDHKTMDQVLLTKRMEFSPDKVVIKTTFLNQYSDTIRFAHRIQNVPGPMQTRRNQESGTACFETEKGVYNFTRINKHYFFKMKQSPVDQQILNTLFGSAFKFSTSGPVKEITRPEVEFKTQNGKTGLKMTVAPETDVNGFVSWDEPDVITFEPVFNSRELPVGQDWTCEMTLEAKQY